jgi:hypothetical protein
MVNYDAVLLDINMPGMGGKETCRRICQAYPRLPIIMLTVRDDERDKVEALDAGAYDYVTKPFQIHELTARLRAAIRRFQNSQVWIALSCGSKGCLWEYGAKAQTARFRVPIHSTDLLHRWKAGFRRGSSFRSGWNSGSSRTMEPPNIPLKARSPKTLIFSCGFSSRSMMKLPSFAFATCLKPINRERSARLVARTASFTCRLLSSNYRRRKKSRWQTLRS